MRPSIVIILLLGMVLPGCAKQPATDVGPGAGAAAPAVALPGTAWRLTEIGAAPAIEGAEATLEFTLDGRVLGNGSCNRFNGGVTTTDRSITFGPLATTRMACPDPAGAQETRYLQALGGAERFETAAGALLIHCKGADSPLKFVRK